MWEVGRYHVDQYQAKCMLRNQEQREDVLGRINLTKGQSMRWMMTTQVRLGLCLHSTPSSFSPSLPRPHTSRLLQPAQTRPLHARPPPRSLPSPALRVCYPPQHPSARPNYPWPPSTAGHHQPSPLPTVLPSDMVSRSVSERNAIRTLRSISKTFCLPPI